MWPTLQQGCVARASMQAHTVRAACALHSTRATPSFPHDSQGRAGQREGKKEEHLTHSNRLLCCPTRHSVDVCRRVQGICIYQTLPPHLPTQPPLGHLPLAAPMRMTAFMCAGSRAAPLAAPIEDDSLHMCRLESCLGRSHLSRRGCPGEALILVRTGARVQTLTMGPAHRWQHLGKPPHKHVRALGGSGQQNHGGRRVKCLSHLACVGHLVQQLSGDGRVQVRPHAALLRLHLHHRVHVCVHADNGPPGQAMCGSASACTRSSPFMVQILFARWALHESRGGTGDAHPNTLNIHLTHPWPDRGLGAAHMLDIHSAALCTRAWTYAAHMRAHAANSYLFQHIGVLRHESQRPHQGCGAGILRHTATHHTLATVRVSTSCVGLFRLRSTPHALQACTLHGDDLTPSELPGQVNKSNSPAPPAYPACCISALACSCVAGSPLTSQPQAKPAAAPPQPGLQPVPHLAGKQEVHHTVRHLSIRRVEGGGQALLLALPQLRQHLLGRRVHAPLRVQELREQATQDMAPPPRLSRVHGMQGRAGHEGGGKAGHRKALPGCSRKPLLARAAAQEAGGQRKRAVLLRATPAGTRSPTGRRARACRKPSSPWNLWRHASAPARRSRATRRLYALVVCNKHARAKTSTPSPPPNLKRTQRHTHTHTTALHSCTRAPQSCTAPSLMPPLALPTP